jgi:hypothetical protein
LPEIPFHHGTVIGSWLNLPGGSAAQGERFMLMEVGVKKAMILYVVHVEEEVSSEGVEELIETLRLIGVSTVFVASSEKEIIHGSFHLIIHGADQILFMRVAYNAGMNWFESRDTPLVLWRKPEKFILSILN